MILTNALVLTFDSANRVLEQGSIEIRSDGSIGKVSGAAGKVPLARGPVVDAGGRLLMPALINCHTHLYSTLARGLVLPGPRPKDFPAVLKKLWWRLDRALDEEDVYYSALLGLIDSAKCGVATVIDHHSSPNACAGSLDQIARAFQEVGLRGATCYETSDRNGRHSAEEAIRENVRFLERSGAGRPSTRQLPAPPGRAARAGSQSARNSRSCPAVEVEGAFGLHAAFTLSDRTLAACRDASQALHPSFHVHLSEHPIDSGAVARLASARILNERTLAAHCVHVTASDRTLLARLGVNGIHNPQSNCTNAVGAADVAALERRGVLVGLGSDGYTPQMWDEFRAAQLIAKLRARDPRAASPDFLGNNSAIAKKVWGWELGRIETGARADLILVDYLPPTPIRPDNFSGHLMSGIAHAPVHSLMVNGRWVVRNRQCVNVDERRVAENTAARAKVLWEKL